MTNWITGANLAGDNLATGFILPATIGDTRTIQLAPGAGTKFPDANFYVFFPQSPIHVDETPEFVYITSRTSETLFAGPDPFNISATGRAAINPTKWPAAQHSDGARVELRNVFEVIQQLQAQMDAHVHNGTTANGPVLTDAAGTNNLSVINNTGTVLSAGDVVVLSGGYAVLMPSSHLDSVLEAPYAVVCSPTGAHPTGSGDYSAANGQPVQVRVGVGWARCGNTVAAGNLLQGVTPKMVGPLAGAGGAIGFALTAATAMTGGYYCKVLLVNRGNDLVTFTGVQSLTNKTLFAPVLYASPDPQAPMTFPTTAGPEKLVGEATAATLTNKILTSPTINGGAISGAVITATNAALTTPAISGGTISGAVAITATSAALTTPSLITPTISGSPIISAADTAFSAAIAKLKVGATSAGFYNTAGNLPYLVAQGSGMVDMPWQSYIHGRWSGTTDISSGVLYHIPATEAVDRQNEWNSSTFTFTPAATGVYLFTCSVTVLFNGGVNQQMATFLKSGTTVLDIPLNNAMLQTLVGGYTLNSSFIYLFTGGETYWMAYYGLSAATPLQVLAGAVSIVRLG